MGLFFFVRHWCVSSVTIAVRRLPVVVTIAAGPRLEDLVVRSGCEMGVPLGGSVRLVAQERLHVV